MKPIATRIKKHITESFKADDFPLMFIAGLAVGTVVMLYIAKFGWHLSPEHKRWAEFGSYVGGVLGATFAFLAFVILLQTLKVNQKELSDTRKVLEKQNALMHQQSFEFTFFELLRLLKTESRQISERPYVRHADFKRALKYEHKTTNISNGIFWEMSDISYLIYEKTNHNPSIDSLMEWYEKIRASNHVVIDLYLGAFQAAHTFLTDADLPKEDIFKYHNILLAHTHYYTLLIVVCQAIFNRHKQPEFLAQLLSFGIQDQINRQDQFSHWINNSLKEI